MIRRYPGISVVIPVYNSAFFIEDTLDSILRSFEFAEMNDFEIIVVNDGSSDNLDDIVRTYEVQGVEIVSQSNQGRRLARINGLKKAKYPLALLIDSRVHLERHALKDVFATYELDGHTAISGPTKFPEHEKFLGVFWESISRIFWFRFYRTSEDIILTKENFDQYPKGTTCLLIPTEIMLRYSEESPSWSHFPLQFQNDDTSILRMIVPEVRFIISRKLDAIYHPRVKFKKFFMHSVHRGGVFLDGHLSVINEKKWRALLILVSSVFVMVTSPYFILFLLFTLFLALIFVFKLPSKNLISLLLYSPFFLIGYFVGIIKSLVAMRRGGM